MKKIILSVAPVAGNAAELDPDAVTEDVTGCAAAGASVVHLHVRDRNARLTDDTSVFSNLVGKIKAKSNLIVEASTGGVSDLTIQQRCAPLDDRRVELASLNVGSVNLGNAVYINSFPDVEYCAGRIVARGKIPDIEVFEIGMIHNVQMIAQKVKFQAPPLYNIVLGQPGAMPATVEALAAFKTFIPQDSPWAFTHYARRDFLLIKVALAMGACMIRVGFEDSASLEGGIRAEKNVQMVEQLAGIVREMGFEVASPDEARSILGIPVRV